jgi:hypothetical protein
VAAVLVGVSRKVGVLKPDEGFFTAWGVWSALLAAAYNSVLREQKNFDDSASHAANMREFEALKALLQTQRERGEDEPGMPPVNASRAKGGDDGSDPGSEPS